MLVIMYIAFLLIAAITIYGGYQAGIYETSYALLKHFIAFFLAFTSFMPAAALTASIIPAVGNYPMLEYLEASVFAVVFIAFISLCDIAKFRYFRSDVEIVINTYADRIVGGLLGTLNATVLTGFILILWASLPFAPYIPGDFGRVNTAALPVDTGELLLKTYARSSDMMGWKSFPLQEAGEDDDVPERLQKGWLWHYKRHADITVYDVKRILEKD